MTKDLIEKSQKRHALADVSLIVTTVTLVVSLAIAATAVSIGIARADPLLPMAAGGGRLALAMFLGVGIAAMGGLTAAMVPDGTYPRRRD